MNQQDRDLLIRLDTKIDNLILEVGEVKGMLTTHDTRIKSIEVSCPAHQISTSIMKAEIEKLRSKANIQDTVVAFGALIGTIIAIVLGR